FGAPSTRSLASFRPRPVNSRTALITFTLFSPNEASTTVNSVCSSTAAAGAPAAGPATATAAAADTPNFSSIALMSSESSSTVIDEILSRISVWTADISCSPEYMVGYFDKKVPGQCRLRRLLRVPHGCERADELRRHLV